MSEEKQGGEKVNGVGKRYERGSEREWWMGLISGRDLWAM